MTGTKPPTPPTHDRPGASDRGDAGGGHVVGDSFERDTDYITTRITVDGRDGFEVEPGCYRLVVSRTCPWANRAIIVRQLLGLHDALPMGVAGPVHPRPVDRVDRSPLRDEIDAVNEVVYADVNNGVYRCGFAGSQRSYETAYHQLFSRLDWLSERLSTQRYLVGYTVTEADVRLFTTLARFDAVYHGHFRCNRSKLSEMPVLWAYGRDLFQTPGFGDTIDVVHIKGHYYEVHRDINPTGIVPVGPALDGWLGRHDREQLGGHPFGDGTPPPPPPDDERVPPDHTPLRDHEAVGR